MARGISINIGVDHPSPRLGFSDLTGCENDANDMYHLARLQGFDGELPLLGPVATLPVVKSAIERAAATLIQGDMLLLTFSGHGSQMPDLDLGEEDDHCDETWVLYDDQLIDDDIFALLAQFNPGVRILVVSDSCDSGTVISIAASNLERGLDNRGGFLGKLFARFGPPRGRAFFRASPDGTSTPLAKTPRYQDILADYFRNRDYYTDRIAAHRRLPRPELKASVILIPACQDFEIAIAATAGSRNSLFTKGLLSVWANGAFQGQYQQFTDQIARLTPGQTPKPFPLGPGSSEFLLQRPFTI